MKPDDFQALLLVLGSPETMWHYPYIFNGHYATEAVHCFLKFLSREKRLKTVYASFFTGNDASRRVMEKCGMYYSHFAEKEPTYLDVPRDLTYYRIQRGAI